MGSSLQEESSEQQSPNTIIGKKGRGRGVDHKAPEMQQSISRKDRIFKAIRNGITAFALFAVIAVVMSTVLLSSNRNRNSSIPEQVVNLGDSLNSAYTGPAAASQLKPQPRRSLLDNKQLKARARYHERIKSQNHGDIRHTNDASRRLMGMSDKGGRGGRSGRSRSKGRNSGRSGGGFRTFMPTPEPSASPSAFPTVTTSDPLPTIAPSASRSPTQLPSVSPTQSPTVSSQPSLSKQPSFAPSLSALPSQLPTKFPTLAPTISSQPTEAVEPSEKPATLQPTFVFRTFMPTDAPTDGPGGFRPTFRSGMSGMSGMGGMGMRGRGRTRAFELDDDRFDDQLQDLLPLLPADLAALFNNN